MVLKARIAIEFATSFSIFEASSLSNPDSLKEKLHQQQSVIGFERNNLNLKNFNRMIKIEATENKEINYNPQQKRINEEIFQRSKLCSSPLLKITPIFSLNHISFSTPMEKPILHVL